MRLFLYPIVAVIVFLTGCRSFEPQQKAALPVTVPLQYSKEAGSVQPTRKWWQMFNSDELNTIIQNALEHNFDLKTGRARLAQAQALLKKEKAFYLPGLDYSFGGQKKNTRIKTGKNRSSVYDGSHLWDVSLSGSWVPDVWGQQDALETSKLFDVQAAGKDLADTELELTAQIAETWIDIIATRKKKKILDNQVSVNLTLLDLQKLRYVNGKADALDVSQQREALAEVKSQVPLLEREEKVLLNALAFLSGKSSSQGLEIKTADLPDSLLSPVVGIPSDLLKNRPDILAARNRLFSTQWEVVAAKTDFLPSVTLTAKALFSSGQLDLLFQNWIATLAASIAGPVFDGGYRKAEVKRAEAVAVELLNKYAQTVARAVQQVEDSLVTIETQDTFIKLLKEELGLARLTLKDAQIQYLNGQSNYLLYMIVLARIEQLERQLVGEVATAVKERIRLYRVLGYGTETAKTADDHAE